MEPLARPDAGTAEDRADAGEDSGTVGGGDAGAGDGGDGGPGGCAHGAPCDADQDGCTQDTCVNGACVAGPRVDCSAKGGPCAVGVCLSQGSMGYVCAADPTPKEGQACDDQNPGTFEDRCAAGVCRGAVYGCADLPRLSATLQQAVVEKDLSCVDEFVAALKQNPAAHLSAFYALVRSRVATNALWSEVYDQARTGRFRFAKTTVDDLYANLPVAVAACSGAYRCADWTKWILPMLERGEMFACPGVFGLTHAAALDALPYGDYDCAEDLAGALGPLASSATVSAVLAQVDTHPRGWARRNGVRAVGRFAGRPSGDAAQVLVTATHAQAVKASLHGRLAQDSHEDVLHDAIWVLDAYFYPYLSMQPELEGLSANPLHDTTLRFRAIAAVARLIYSKAGLLPSADVAYLKAAIASDDKWVRAEAAYIVEALKPSQHDATIKGQLVAALQAQHAVETELLAKVYQARALDKLTGSALLAGLRSSYEAQHLGATLDGGDIHIRSGLDAGVLPSFEALMRDEKAAFFALLGAGFSQPVPQDPNPSMTLVLFATQATYQEYMDAFVGYGSSAGGLYLEGKGTLYTYERTSAQSRFTVQELVRHEYGHYLQGRYVYPGLWGSAGYFTESKAWADEGLSELLVGVYLDGGVAVVTSRPGQLQVACSQRPFRSLSSLLSQRAGYDQPGTFDYANGWAFQHYLWTKNRSSALGVYQALRANTYALASFATHAGQSVAALEAGWHAELTASCPPAPPSPVPAWSVPVASVCSELLRVSEEPAPSPPRLR